MLLPAFCARVQTVPRTCSACCSGVVCVGVGRCLRLTGPSEGESSFPRWWVRAINLSELLLPRQDVQGLCDQGAARDPTVSRSGFVTRSEGQGEEV